MSNSTENKKFDLKKEIFSYIIIIAIAFAIAFVFNNFILLNASIPSSSMETTIMKGDKIIGNRLAFVFSSPERGDIIIFKNPDNEEEKFVKRVVGLPGETLEIKDGIVYIDGEALDEYYLPSHPYMNDFEAVTVPEGCYFMMGDNRTNSKDSRYWVNTFLSEEKILAKAVLVYSPDFHFLH